MCSIVLWQNHLCLWSICCFGHNYSMIQSLSLYLHQLHSCVVHQYLVSFQCWLVILWCIVWGFTWQIIHICVQLDACFESNCLSAILTFCFDAVLILAILIVFIQRQFVFVLLHCSLSMVFSLFDTVVSCCLRSLRIKRKERKWKRMYDEKKKNLKEND